MTRREAIELVKSAGGTAVTTVSRRTSIVVVGMNGWPLLPDGTVSRKLARAETLNRGGARIRIISEAAFLDFFFFAGFAAFSRAARAIFARAIRQRTSAACWASTRRACDGGRCSI